MHREIEYLIVSNMACNLTPNLVGFDIARKLIILEYVEGSSYLDQCIDVSDLNYAARLFTKTNEYLKTNHIAFNSQAADSSMSPNVHLEQIASKYQLIQKGLRVYSGQFEQDYLRFVDDVGKKIHKVTSKWSSSSSSILTEFKKSTEPEMILSPGDFGFHNAIKRLNGNPP